MSTHTLTFDTLLPPDLLAEMDRRAVEHDRHNSFCQQDLDDLRSTGYLQAAVPLEYGGSGLRLRELSALQQRLAFVAPATALAINMHLYWTGLAADLERAGDGCCRFLLEWAAAGKTLAAIHGERGNDVPLFLSTTSATRLEGAWEIDGHKIFGSLSPVWDAAGFHAMETEGPDGPRIVHGFVLRDDPGVEIVETWDSLGMRATQSHDTILHRVRVPDERVALVCAPGFAGAGMFHVGIFAWALLGFASVYQGAAQRAFDLALESAKSRTSLALTRSMAYHPEIQHLVAEMRMDLDAGQALLDRVTGDWSDGVAHPDWPVRILGARDRIIGGAFRIVDLALDASGGGAAFRRNRLEQLFRDVRMGRFHPGNTVLTHEVIGKLCLGVDPDDTQRWG